MIIETEIWRTVIYDGEMYEKYQASNFGQILSLNYRGTGKSKLLKTSKDKDGYFRVGFRKDGKYKNFLVHRLVAETFISNPDNLPQVNHKDENKENNFVGTPENDYKDGNLEWCTHEYNSNYGTRNERTAKANTNGKKSKKVLQFTLTGDFIREWESTRECERKGYNHTNIVSCCNGKQKKHKGYIWKYKE